MDINTKNAILSHISGIRVMACWDALIAIEWSAAGEVSCGCIALSWLLVPLVSCRTMAGLCGFCWQLMSLAWSLPNVTASQVGIKTLQLHAVPLSTILTAAASHAITCRVTDANSTYMCATTCHHMAIRGEFLISFIDRLMRQSLEEMTNQVFVVNVLLPDWLTGWLTDW